MTKREKVNQMLIEMDEETLLFDGFDDAIIGIGHQQYKGPLVIYDRDKCIDILMTRDKLSHEEAEEYFSYNTEGAWVGNSTPIIVQRV